MGSTQSLLDELKKAIKEEQSRRKREKYLRIFLYAVGGIIAIFAMFKLARIVQSTRVFSNSR